MSSILMRGGVALAVVAGLAGAASRALVPASEPAVLPVAAVATVSEAPRNAQAEPDCVKAFSKDFCDGLMYPGGGVVSECPTGTQECKTIRVTQATFLVPLQPNYTNCSSDGRCDESPENLDEMKVSVDWIMRLQEPCRFRACWEGKGEVRKQGGGSVSYVGTLMGTMGAGTHRDFVCPKHRTAFCERCLDVEFIATDNLWRIGFEASFHGKRADQPTGEEVCISISGDFYASGDDRGPYDLTGNWGVYGTADGIWLTHCQ